MCNCEILTDVCRLCVLTICVSNKQKSIETKINGGKKMKEKCRILHLSGTGNIASVVLNAFIIDYIRNV